MPLTPTQTHRYASTANHANTLTNILSFYIYVDIYIPYETSPLHVTDAWRKTMDALCMPSGASCGDGLIRTCKWQQSNLDLFEYHLIQLHTRTKLSKRHRSEPQEYITERGNMNLKLQRLAIGSSNVIVTWSHWEQLWIAKKLFSDWVVASVFI